MDGVHINLFTVIKRNSSSPAKNEIAHAKSKTYSYEKINIIGHNSQHKEVADHNVDDLKKGLDDMSHVEHLLCHSEI